ncbi:ATP-binding cassette domain-containing protein [Hoeflea sp. G2-23]|uniref:ATP-binding cassette domain-containing protein n=1 Tax=Hoeflea algicola TaxID=2983763 RepID=A0ABT3ZDV1_9HYPH|nr:ATP-binding cassette domain-containing protein [Hoeflea algicola]MCY0149821.1 ATP-binding cassette domain-containing protein [Hoeflea algicola]
MKANDWEAPKGTKTFLHAKSISKSYGGLKAVSEVDLKIHRGEVVALVGDNGAGKSTLIKMLSGVISPDRGAIEIDGQPIRFLGPSDARTAGIETLHQHLGLVEVFNVPENIFLGQELTRRRLGIFKGLDHAKMRRLTEELLRRVDLRLPSLDQPVKAMSGGQRQAVAITRMLLNEVHLLIMDEPMAALGVDEGRKVLDLIVTLRERELSTLIISHNLEHVFAIADRIAVMKNGELISVVNTRETTSDEVVGMIVSGRSYKEA